MNPAKPDSIALRRDLRRWIAMGTAALVMMGAAIVYYRYDPTKTPLLPCFFYRTTHLLCPGCGSQRAAHELLHLHLLAALHDNALICLLIPVLAWELIARATRALPAVLHRPLAGWLIVWMVVIFWIVRNVPAWPCTLLKPLG